MPDRIIEAVNDFPKRKKGSLSSLITHHRLLLRPLSALIHNMQHEDHLNALQRASIFSAFFETIKSPWPSSSYAHFGSPSHTTRDVHTNFFRRSLWFVQFLWFFVCCYFFSPLFFIACSAFHWLTTRMILRCSIGRALCVSRVFHVFLSPPRRRIALFIFDDYEYFFWGEGNDELVRGTKNQKYLHSISFDLIVE